MAYGLYGLWSGELQLCFLSYYPLCRASGFDDEGIMLGHIWVWSNVGEGRGGQGRAKEGDSPPSTSTEKLGQM